MAKKSKNADIIRELKLAVYETYHLPVTLDDQFDQFLTDMLRYYYEIPSHTNDVVRVIRKALREKGVAKDLKESNVYDEELENVLLKWQGDTKFDVVSWTRLLS